MSRSALVNRTLPRNQDILRTHLQNVDPCSAIGTRRSQGHPMQERRTERRFAWARPATLLVGTSSAINCTVHDISATGAGLTASGAAGLSGRVELTLDGGRTYRAARVAWGLMDRAGIKFDVRP